jgi:predicted nucleic acid-binding protein
MKALLDINIVLNVFLNRQPFVNEAALIWQANANRQIEVFVSAVTLPTIYYITRKATDKATARQVVQKLLASVGIVGVDYAVLANAETLPIDDYEDAVQLAAAQAQQIDAIVTRDMRDYHNSPLPVYSPSDFLALI